MVIATLTSSHTKLNCPQMATSNLLLTSTSADNEGFPLAFLSVFRVQFTLAVLLPLAFYLAHAIRKDYHAFLALGPGGTPSTPSGYLRICILRLVTIRNPLEPPSIPPTLHPTTGVLSRSTIPMRPGSRPIVKGIAPQRQITQKASSAIYDSLSKQIHTFASSHPNTLYTATSCFEKHSTGIFYSLPTNPTPSTSNATSGTTNHRMTCNGEVCHSHPSDGSLHLTLHPADIKLVLERGWAQRHPLATDNWWWGPRSVPRGFVMVYAPRSEEEVKVVGEIIRAAAWWVGGKEDL
ncbi:uncharacterized protein BDV14DRAFT_76356 [Aspergillus stella-maris]|uniref:uncharacterized protein n=1 Tax=Aspergillus stella-maris TaxID=1810926 RepID=UPI003CCDF983